MKESLRKTGIDIIGDVPWGTHCCQFYQTPEDLSDILAPYFKAGLENNEFCLWVTSEPLNSKKAIKKLIPDFEQYLNKEQIKIIPHTNWYLKDGVFNQQRVIAGWINELNQALAKGYDGMRVTGNTAWLEKEDWQAFSDYEAEINKIIGKYQMLAICSYSLDKCGAFELIEVAGKHQFALIKQAAEWVILESSVRKQAEAALRRVRYELEIRVEERTTELAKTNQQLQIEIAERKQAEDKLKQAYQTTQDVLEKSPFGIYVVNADGNIEYVNPAMLKIAGDTYEQFKNLNVFELPTYQRLGLSKNIRAGLKGKYFKMDAAKYTSHFSHKTTIRNFSGIPLKENNARKVLMIVEDITNAKRAEVELAKHRQQLEELVQERTAELTKANKRLKKEATERKWAGEERRKSEEKYKSVVDNVGVGVMLISPNMEVLSINKQAADWFPAVDVSKKPICYKIFNAPPKENICSYCLTYKTLKDGQVHESIIETSIGDEIRNFKIVSSPLKDHTGEITAAIEMMEDITEYKRAEEKIKLLAIFPAENPDPVLRIRNDGYIQFANPAAWPIIAALKTKPGQFLPAKWKQKVEEIYNSQSSQEIEINHQDQIFSIKITPFIDTDYLYAYGRNITEHKRMEEALRESEAKFQDFRDNAPDMFVSVDAKTARILQCNQAVEQATGYTKEEIIGRSIFDMYHPDCKEAAEKMFHSFVTTGKVHDVELQLRRKDGSKIDVSLNTSAVRDEQGNILHSRSVWHDITERKRVEQEIKLIANFSAENPNPVLRIKSDGYIEYANSASRTILDAIEGKPRQFLSSKWKKRLSKIYDSQKTKEVEVKYKGQVFSISITPFADTDYLYAYGRDITQRKQIEEKIQIYQEQLRFLAAELSFAEERERRRIATELHDYIIQNLGFTKIRLEVLEEAASGFGQDTHLNNINELQKIIEEMIKYTRALTFDLSPPILYELGFEAAVEWLVEQINERHDILTSFEDDLQFKPLDDDIRILLFQSTRELLVNAVKHAQAHQVKLFVSRKKDQIQINIEDDGVGFDPAKISSQLDKNSGFGLFSIRERLDYLGGCLELDSVPGGGTRANLLAPLKLGKHALEEKTI